jgi:hypothetical protein
MPEEEIAPEKKSEFEPDLEVQSSDPLSQSEQGSFIDLPSRFDRFEPLAELIATFVLALATLAAAWSGYEASRWGGVQSTAYSQAGALRTESTRASTSAGQLIQIDIAIFTNWINAYASDQQDLMNFYEERFRPDFLPAFEAWLETDPENNPDAPLDPFLMSEYSLPEIEESRVLLEQAQDTFEEGQEANQTSDNYVFMTIIFASVLFLGGIQSRFKSIPARLVIIFLSLLILAYGLYNLITFPII